MRKERGAPVTSHIGQERALLVSLDDALSDPQRVRAMASVACFAVDSPFYPGVRAPLPQGVAAEVERLSWPVLAEHFGCRRGLNIKNASFALTVTAPAQLRPPQRIPHYDGTSDSQFAVLIHLGFDDLGGTGFFRHRSTGYESIGPERELSYFAALRSDLERFGRPKPSYIDESTAIYERIAVSSARFNRMILYRGNMLHSAMLRLPEGLSACPATGRLTITCFIDAD
ncbi:hypothetical protein HH800_13310 [Sphingobium yanoikuyae]|uniref:Uncharacterized protein n=1 Tax=Sphingobium yanoikuyae TaxID=13690 RepID=A0A6M4G9W2_SPHYA|nr:DUF6445 family protein [Sphingobium yanoikuyae]QJR03063.1 hypothetical protein HH800_13310 [Sphingobium yanoikuyae]